MISAEIWWGPSDLCWENSGESSFPIKTQNFRVRDRAVKMWLFTQIVAIGIQ